MTNEEQEKFDELEEQVKQLKEQTEPPSKTSDIPLDFIESGLNTGMDFLGSLLGMPSGKK